jgi:hypothetical protein
MSLGLRLDLGKPIVLPPARVPLTVRRFQPDEDHSWLTIFEEGGSNSSAHYDLFQRRMLESGIPFWVGTGPGGNPAYFQAMLTEQDNDKVRALFGDSFPRIGPDEVLFEAAYTVARYRWGFGIGPHMVARLAVEAKAMKKRWAVTFVHADNVSALKLARNAGFVPYLLRYETWKLMKSSVRFTRPPTGTRYPFETGSPSIARQSITS